jgi:hypothetical protein
MEIWCGSMGVFLSSLVAQLGAVAAEDVAFGVLAKEGRHEPPCGQSNNERRFVSAFSSTDESCGTSLGCDL